MKGVSVMGYKSGAVSLFAVIFGMLVITVATVSFLRLMVSDQEQATNANLAQSARNSAEAGVEDAKRAILYYMEQCSNDESTCSALEDELSSDECNAALEMIGAGVAGEEVIVQQNLGDELLQQAYTCVQIELNTDDYLGTSTASTAQVIPLFTEDEYFDNVTIEWFTQEDMESDSVDGYALDLPAEINRTLTSAWPLNRPSLMAVQLMQFGDTFTLDDFDATDSGESNTNTVFLYPTSDGTTNASIPFTSADLRRSVTDEESIADSPNNTPYAVGCEPNIDAGGYACKARFTLPDPIGGGDRTAYLRVTSYYLGSHFRVTMQDSSTSNTVQFSAVQPEVDSTGRANNVFKRVVTRVSLYGGGSTAGGYLYPNAAVEVDGNFCKDFGVTDEEYIDGSCTP